MLTADQIDQGDWGAGVRPPPHTCSLRLNYCQVRLELLQPVSLIGQAAEEESIITRKLDTVMPPYARLRTDS